MDDTRETTWLMNQCYQYQDTDHQERQVTQCQRIIIERILGPSPGSFDAYEAMQFLAYITSTLVKRRNS